MSKLTRFRIVELDSAAIPAKDVTLNPLNVNFIDDDNFTGYWDSSAGRAASRWGEAGFTTELKGRTASQALTDKPSIDSLLLAAGFVGAAGASDYHYTLSSKPNDDKVLLSALNIYYHKEVTAGTSGLRHRIANVATDMTFTANAGQIAEIAWSCLGQFVANPDLATVPSALAQEGNPLRALAGAIITTIGGVSKTLSLNSLTLSLGNNVVLPDLIGKSYGKGEPEITTRNTTIELVVIEPDKATLDFWYAMQESGLIDQIAQPINFSMLLGTTAKNKVTIVGGGYMSGFPERTDIDGISYYTIRLKYDRSAWHVVPTQIKITFT